MYPNIGSSATQPSAPPPPSTASTTNASSLANSNPGKPVGFSSLMSQPQPQPPNQTGPYSTSQTSQSMYPGQQPSQAPYPGGQRSQPPYPAGPPSASPYTNSYPPNNPPSQPPNTGNYSPYTLPQTGQAPTQGAGYQANPYSQSSNPYQNSNPSAGYQQAYPGYQQPPPPPTGPNYQNPYPPSNQYQPQPGNNANQNPYRPANPYGSQQGQPGYQNPSQPFQPYQSQPGGYPQQQQQPPPPPSQYQSSHPPQNPPPPSQYQNSYPPQNPPPPQGGGYGGYPPYQQQPYQNPYGNQPPGGGHNANAYGAPIANDRLRAITGRHEISDALAQRLNILQQFELVVLCDDSGSMNTPVDGTQGTRWDELRAIVQIIIEIGTIFDSNGVDVHFLNRAPMLNVTDARQVVESFSQRPSGLTPLTAALRRIFQSAASKPGNDKRLLVFVATDGAPTDTNGTADIPGLENLMRNERQANTTYVTFLACTDDESSVAYLSQWDRSMLNVDVVDDFKTEREEIRRVRGLNYPFSFGDYVAKALLGAVDPQMDLLDEAANNNNNNTNNNFRRY